MKSSISEKPPNSDFVTLGQWRQRCFQLLWPANVINDTSSNERANRFIDAFPAFQAIIDLDHAVGGVMRIWQTRGLPVDVDQWSRTIDQHVIQRQYLQSQLGLEGDASIARIRAVREARCQFGDGFQATTKWLKQHESVNPRLGLLRQYLTQDTTIRQYKLTYKEKSQAILHGNWSVHGTYSGRLACHERNLLALPSELHSAWRPISDGNRLIQFDLSAIELRIAAALSNDIGLITAFESGEDLHMADGVFICNLLGVHVTSETELHRLGKRVIYALLFGAGPTRIKKTVESIAEETILSGAVIAMITKFKQRYQKMFTYLMALEKRTILTTPFGNVPISANLRSTQLRNLPIQFMESLLLKQLILEFRNDKIIMPIHDALLFEVNPAQQVSFKHCVKERVPAILQTWLPGLPTTKIIKFQEM